MSRFTRASALFAAYFTLGVATWISAALSGYGLLSGSSTNSSQGQSSNAPNALGIGNLSAGLNNNLANYTTALPSWLSSYYNTINQPTGGFQAGANAAGVDYGNNAASAGQFGNALAGQYGPLINAGNSIYNAGMDPQGALYKSLLQQTTDSAGATNAMYGLGSSGAGAGVQNDAISNFLINWQNQQLGRQQTGLSGMEGAYGAGANALGGAQNFYGLMPQNDYMSGALPFQTAQSINAIPGQAASQLYGEQYNADVAPYLGASGMSGGSSSSSSQNPLMQQMLMSNALFTSGNNLYNSGGGTLGNYFGNLTGGSPSNTSNSSVFNPTTAFNPASVYGLNNNYGSPAAGETNWLNSLGSGGPP